MRILCLSVGALAVVAGCVCEDSDNCEVDGGPPWSGTMVRWDTNVGQVLYDWKEENCSLCPVNVSASAPIRLGGCVVDNDLSDKVTPWDDWIALRDSLLPIAQGQCDDQLDEVIWDLNEVNDPDIFVVNRYCIGPQGAITDTHQVRMFREDCPPENAESVLEEPKVLTWTPADEEPDSPTKGGDPDFSTTFTATPAPLPPTGKVGYQLGTADKDGARDAWLTDVQLDEPLLITTGTFDATVLLGYPAGTEIEVTEVSVHPTQVALDKNGAGSIGASELVFEVVAMIAEPDSRVATEHRLVGTNPWALSLVIDENGLELDPLFDSLGGLLELDSLAAPTSTKTK